MNTIPRQLIGRVAALLTVLGSLSSLVAEILERGAFPSGWTNTFISMGIGAILWFLPWARLGVTSTRAFLLLSLAALFFGELSSDETTRPEGLSLFLITLFAWNGLAHRRWSSLKVAPFALAVMIGPGLIVPAKEVTVYAAALTIPMCVFVGELVAWISSHLVVAEEERHLAALKADFLTAASHEMRTPLTALVGYAKLLSQRLDALSQDQVKEFADSITHSADRLESIIARLVDIDHKQASTELADERIGLMGAHYVDGGARNVQPETLVHEEET